MSQYVLVDIDIGDSAFPDIGEVVELIDAANPNRSPAQGVRLLSRADRLDVHWADSVNDGSMVYSGVQRYFAAFTQERPGKWAGNLVHWIPQDGPTP